MVTSQSFLPNLYTMTSPPASQFLSKCRRNSSSTAALDLLLQARKAVARAGDDTPPIEYDDLDDEPMESNDAVCVGRTRCTDERL